MIDKRFLPLDKSWIIRMGILDLVNGYEDIKDFLLKQANLGGDLKALKKVTETWKTDLPLDVGESGTLYRLLKFASWKLNLNKKFIKQGTLAERDIADDPKMAQLSQRELLKLDNGTSQWASAAALLGDEERLFNPPFKLELTYQAIDHWISQREKGSCWEPRCDETIQKQAEAYLELLNGNRPEFKPEQAEDFCFAYVFGYMTAEAGEEKWPALRGHESDRIAEIQTTLQAAKDGEDIASKDHRVVQAIAMWGKINKRPLDILYPQVVNKSWPQFWDFLNTVN